MNEILTLPATCQAQLIRTRKISSRELIEAHLRQIERVNPKVNAVVEVLAERALAEAGAADAALASGKAMGPLQY
jgi:amidase